MARFTQALRADSKQRSGVVPCREEQPIHMSHASIKGHPTPLESARWRRGSCSTEPMQPRLSSAPLTEKHRKRRGIIHTSHSKGLERCRNLTLISCKL